MVATLQNQMIRFFLTIIASQFLFKGTLYSQRNDDAQLWENIYLEKNLTQRLAIHLNQEGRLTENCTTPNYIYGDLGITYNVNKHLHLSVAYVPISKRTNTGYVSFRQQFYFNFVLKYKFHHFVFYDRQMFQNQYNDIDRSANWDVPDYYLRNKVTVKYKNKSRFTPYVAEEVYFKLDYFHRNGREIDRMRYFAGTFYELNAVDSLEFYYLIEPHFHIFNPFTNWIMGIGYSHSFY